MPWFKVDDHFWSHPKTSPLSDGATALWLRAGSWSSGHLTDGVVPVSMLRMFRARRRSADELVTAGLWSNAGDTFVFTSWHEYQPSKVQVEARREATKTRVNTWREGKSNGVTETFTGAPRNAPPDPTRPDPTRSTSKEVLKDSRSAAIEALFDDAYSHWPKKTEKDPAREKFKSVARMLGAQEIHDHIVRFGDAYAATTDRQYVPGLGTWLNKKRWTDELPAGPTSGSTRGQENLAMVAKYAALENNQLGIES